MHNQPLDYGQIDEALAALGADFSAAEAHGTLCGLLSASHLDSLTWMQQVLPEAAGSTPDPAARQLLDQLHGTTLAQLGGEGCEFQPLLPDDGEPLAVRAEALGDWCQGYLLGLSLAGLSDFTTLPDNAREITQDLASLARAGSYRLEDNEEDEGAYAELLEYLRVGVLLINEELQPRRGPQPSHQTLH